jgi:RNA polymerase sigma-70 factor (ECF subfamily)
VKPDGSPDPSKQVVEPIPAAADRVAPDEAEWIRKAGKGDERAFAQLVDRHRDRAFALASRMLRSSAEAEEVAQDAFVRVWRALPRFRGDAAFSTWLHRIVVRCALDRLAVLKNRRAREEPNEAPPEVPAPPDASLDPEARERARRMEQVMERLTETQRTVVALFYHEDRAVEEVARILGMPENTVKTLLHRARAAMREAWLEQEGTT